MAATPRTEKTRLHRLGAMCMGAGVLLLALFFVVKGWTAMQSRAAADAFTIVRGGEPELPVVARNPDIARIDIPAPDFSLWADSRVGHYRESLRAGGDAPRAVLNIDRLNIRVPVYNGATGNNLNRGAARVLGTGRFDGKGNLAIAGHRDGFFRPLKDIRVGDTFTLQTQEATRQYRVSSIRIIEPTEVSVLAPTDTPSVTLVTCYPFYFVGKAPKRFIVRGEVQSTQVSS